MEVRNWFSLSSREERFLSNRVPSFLFILACFNSPWNLSINSFKFISSAISPIFCKASRSLDFISEIAFSAFLFSSSCFIAVKLSGDSSPSISDSFSFISSSCDIALFTSIRFFIFSRSFLPIFSISRSFSWSSFIFSRLLLGVIESGKWDFIVSRSRLCKSSFILSISLANSGD